MSRYLLGHRMAAPTPRLLASVLVLALFPGCTLIAVGKVVGKGFVPALAKGDKEALKRHSTDRLAGYWDVFTEEEIQAAVGADQGPRKPGQKRAKGPRVRLVSFKVKGHEAELVARRGEERFRFLCQRTVGGWKVADVSFRLKGQPRELVRMLQVLVAAKTLQRGLERGSRYLLHNVSSPGFRARVLGRIGDAELLFLENAVSKTPKRPAKGKGRPRSRIQSEVTPEGALVRTTGGPLPVEIRLVEADGQFLVDAVSLRLGGSQHGLGDLLDYTAPALRLLRWVVGNLTQEGKSGPPGDLALKSLREHIQGLFSQRVWGSSLAWLSVSDLKLLPWDAMRAALSSLSLSGGTGEPSPSSPESSEGGSGPSDGESDSDSASASDSVSASDSDSDSASDSVSASDSASDAFAITRLQREGNRLHLEGALRGHRFGLMLLEEAGAWRIHGAWFQPVGAEDRSDAMALLAALGPLVNLGLVVSRLVPELFEGEERGRAALSKLLAVLRAGFSADANRRLWSLLPRGFVQTAPLDLLPRRLRDLVPGIASGSDADPGPGPGGAAGDAAQPGGSPGAAAGGRGSPSQGSTGIRVLRVRQTESSLQLHLEVSGRPLRLDLLREEGGWKLDDVQLPLAGEQRSLKDVGGLLIPAINLAHAVLGSDREALRLAMTPAIRRDVVDPLLHVFGWRFKRLMGTLRKRLLPSATAPPRAASPSQGAKAQGGAGDRAPGKGIRLDTFMLDSTGGRATLGIVLGAGGRVQAELARDPEGRWGIGDLRFPLAGREVSLSRAGPVLAPILGFGLSLLAGDLAAVRRASSRGFNAAAWRRMTQAKFRKLVSQISGGGGSRKGGSSGAGLGSPKASAPPRFVALRIREKVRWPWAQVELDVGGRRIMASLVKERGNWKVHDLHVQIGGLTMSVKKLIALGF